MDAINPDVVTQYEHETWSRCAESYVDTFARLTGETLPWLRKAAVIEPGHTVLEIGSGPGHVADALAQAGAKVTGIDFSGDMVQVARRRFPDIEFHEANAEELPFNAASFDIVVSNMVVHHLARPDVAFKEAHRVLKSGGRFAFSVWGALQDQSSIMAFMQAVETHHNLGEVQHGPLFGVTDPEVFTPLLTDAGFAECRFDTHDIEWRSDSLDPILRGFWDWGDLDALPRDLQDKIEATVRENAQPFATPSGFAFPHTVFVGGAIKR